MSGVTSPLDKFLLSFVTPETKKILDFGCGSGRFVKICRSLKLDAYGADTFKGIYADYADTSNFILRIKEDHVPAASESFSFIVSNQVLEHIPKNKMNAVSEELIRLLSKDGFSINIFPTHRTLIEPHVGIFGAHWLKSGSKLQKFYLTVSFVLGFGYWRSENKYGKVATFRRIEWVEDKLNSLEKHCFYVPAKKWKKNFQERGVCVENVSYLLLIFVSPKILARVLIHFSKSKFGKDSMNFLVEARVGVVLKISANHRSLIYSRF